MSKGLQFLILLLLLPALAEGIGSDLFIVIVPGFPLSLGGTLFIISGILGFFISGSIPMRTKIFLGLLLVNTGCLIGSFFGEKIAQSVSNSLAGFLFIFASGGLANIWSNKPLRVLIDFFFIVSFLYWLIYILESTILQGQLVSYSMLHSQREVINHHVPGLNISVSATYVAVRFFIATNKFRFLGFLIIGSAIVGCMLIESRSNFIFSLIIFIVLSIQGKKKIIKKLFVLIPVFLALYLGANFLMSNYLFLNQRFNVRDFEYQRSTNLSRTEIILSMPSVVGEDIMGRGIRDVYINIKGVKMLAHNQYLTFIIAGGLLALMGIGIWGIGLFKIWSKILKGKKAVPKQPFLNAAGMALFIFHLTLFTIEFGNILFYILASLGIYCSKILHWEERKLILPPAKSLSFVEKSKQL